MPIFGNPNEFGLECKFRSFSGKWCFGSLRAWIGGRRVGDFEDSTEDLLQLTHNRAGLVLDLGWYPEFDPNGNYVLYLFRGSFDAGTCLAEFRTAKHVEIVREIERLLDAATKDELAER